MDPLFRIGLILLLLFTWYFLIFRSLMDQKERYFGKNRDWVGFGLAAFATGFTCLAIILNTLVLFGVIK